ncbi:MAG: sulfotransferase family protein [Phycisphaerales bacterium]
MRTGGSSQKQKVFEDFRKIESLQKSGQRELALEASKALASKQSSWPYAHYALAGSYANLGRYEEARRAARKAISLKGDVGAFHAKLGEILHRLDDIEGARKAFEQSIEVEPDEISHKVSLAWALRLSGHQEEAFEMLDALYSAGSRDHRMVRIYANLLGQRGEHARGVEVLEPLTKEQLPDMKLIGAHWYVLARLYDTLGRYDDAYAAATRGAEINAKHYDPAEREWLQDRRFEAWSKESMPALERSRSSTEKIVFIVGMPRSGTTLVEQIIGAHPKAYGAGELINIFNAVRELVTPADDSQSIADMARQLKTATLDRTARRILRDMEKQAPSGTKPERICDKLLLNFQHLGFIEQLFPKASVIICKRHPLDVYISSYLLDFEGVNAHAYTDKPEWFAHFYALHLKYIEHFKQACSLPIMEVQYEDIVTDQRTQTERILEHIGLGFDEACMRFYEHERAVNTASTDQVRQKLYTGSIRRFERYEAHLEPVRSALTEHGVSLD